MSLIWAQLPAQAAGRHVQRDVASCCRQATAHVNIRESLWPRKGKREQFVLPSCQDTFCSFLLRFTLVHIGIGQYLSSPPPPLAAPGQGGERRQTEDLRWRPHLSPLFCRGKCLTHTQECKRKMVFIKPWIGPNNTWATMSMSGVPENRFGRDQTCRTVDTKVLHLWEVHLDLVFLQHFSTALTCPAVVYTYMYIQTVPSRIIGTLQ